MLCAAVLGGTIAGAQTSSAVDAAFAQFFAARTLQESAAAIDRIVASGIPFDAATARLRAGRPYSGGVARGVVERSSGGGAAAFFYTLDVPPGYDPARRYPLWIQLHGGVGRITAATSPRPRAALALGGADHISAMPGAWRDAPWWSRGQLDNLRAMLDAVKRTYNVDENRVVLSGVSDGGTGAYYVAMRDTTPYASFLALNGFVRVLDNETAEADGDLFPGNLVNKPLFVVNGGRDPLYPSSLVDPVVQHLRNGGVNIDYRPQPAAAHDTSWWPAIAGTVDRFVADRPRQPLPDAISWQSGPPNLPARAHWLVIDRLGDTDGGGARFADLNAMPAGGAAPEFGIRASGARVTRVLHGSNAEQVGVRAGDAVAAINNQPIADGADVADMLRSFPAGRPLLLSVVRGSEAVRLTGRYAPGVLPGGAGLMFARSTPSGRVDVKRTGNRIDVRCAGVAAFTLLLSADQFDLTRAVSVVVNGRTVLDRIVSKDLRTLLTWAARDNDRTMLFAAAVAVAVP